MSDTTTKSCGCKNCPGPACKCAATGTAPKAGECCCGPVCTCGESCACPSSCNCPATRDR